MRLDQDGEEFAGTYGPATGRCVGPVGMEPLQATGAVVDGKIIGDQVEFDTANFRQTGSFHDDGNMNGTVTWTQGSNTYTGVWSAVREFS